MLEFLLYFFVLQKIKLDALQNYAIHVSSKLVVAIYPQDCFSKEKPCFSKPFLSLETDVNSKNFMSIQIIMMSATFIIKISYHDVNKGIPNKIDKG